MDNSSTTLDPQAVRYQLVLLAKAKADFQRISRFEMIGNILLMIMSFVYGFVACCNNKTYSIQAPIREYPLLTSILFVILATYTMIVLIHLFTSRDSNRQHYMKCMTEIDFRPEMFLVGDRPAKHRNLLRYASHLLAIPHRMACDPRCYRDEGESHANIMRIIRNCTNSYSLKCISRRVEPFGIEDSWCAVVLILFTLAGLAGCIFLLRCTITEEYISHNLDFILAGAGIGYFGCSVSLMSMYFATRVTDLLAAFDTHFQSLPNRGIPLAIAGDRR